MSWGMIVVGTLSAGVNMVNASKNRKAAEGIANAAAEDKRIEQGKLDKQKAEYKAMKFQNPFSNMENVYEDLTVNQQQAQFQAQQGSQQRANIMQGLRGAAGTSGIAGLAQAMAQQGQLQTQQISAGISQQEIRNQQLALAGADRQRQLIAQGEAQADLQERAGEAMLQEAEMSRQATLLGMQYGSTAGAQSAYQQALLSQQQAGASANQMWGQSLSSLSNINWGGGGSGVGSGVPQFTNTIPSGTSPSGAPLTVPVVTPTGPEIYVPPAPSWDY